MILTRAGPSGQLRGQQSQRQRKRLAAAGNPDSAKIACGGAPQDTIEETLIVSASSLSYDAASDTYTYLWKTNKAWPGTCRQLNLKLNDGSEHKANFKFVR